MLKAFKQQNDSFGVIILLRESTKTKTTERTKYKN